MKTRLLKKLRKRGRSQIHIYSVTKTNGLTTGMSIGYDNNKYSHLFNIGDTERDVYKKAERIYINDYLNSKK